MDKTIESLWASFQHGRKIVSARIMCVVATIIVNADRFGRDLHDNGHIEGTSVIITNSNELPSHESYAVCLVVLLSEDQVG
jgi:hypothetical protein